MPTPPKKPAKPIPAKKAKATLTPKKKRYRPPFNLTVDQELVVPVDQDIDGEGTLLTNGNFDVPVEGMTELQHALYTKDPAGYAQMFHALVAKSPLYSPEMVHQKCEDGWVKRPATKSESKPVQTTENPPGYLSRDGRHQVPFRGMTSENMVAYNQRPKDYSAAFAEGLRLHLLNRSITDDEAHAKAHEDAQAVVKFIDASPKSASHTGDKIMVGPEGELIQAEVKTQFHRKEGAFHNLRSEEPIHGARHPVEAWICDNVTHAIASLIGDWNGALTIRTLQADYQHLELIRKQFHVAYVREHSDLDAPDDKVRGHICSIMAVEVADTFLPFSMPLGYIFLNWENDHQARTHQPGYVYAMRIRSINAPGHSYADESNNDMD